MKYCIPYALKECDYRGAPEFPSISFQCIHGTQGFRRVASSNRLLHLVVDLFMWLQAQNMEYSSQSQAHPRLFERDSGPLIQTL